MGIIPAYAGSTFSFVRLGAFLPDHPRIRGEHSGLPLAEWRRAGSSPHTRGAPASRSASPRSRRIIPAYAGSTPIGRRSAGASADHPRIRGEHCGRGRFCGRGGGSSPHTRGARRAAPAEGELYGIIPAYAGSTVFDNPAKDNVPDHPRIRGEHHGSGRVIQRVGGSSPHTRGAPKSRPFYDGSSRIIPAYAGSTR